MIERRVPEWFRDDSLVKTVDDEVSFIEINSYYDWLRTYVKQPIQIWREIKDLDPLDAQINVRLHAEPEYPLREVNLYEDCLGDGTDDVIFTKTYRKYDKVTEDFIEFTSEPTLERCYVEVKYHCLNGSIIVGFPQDANATDEAFLPNEFLDKHAKELGLFRRTYKTTIPDTDLPYTYPMGYPYSVEQDYYLEKRLLNEYPSRRDKTPYVVFEDTNGVDAIRIRSGRNEVSNIEIRSRPNSILKVYLEGMNEVMETYAYTGIRDLVDQINEKSANIKAEKITGYDLTQTLSLKEDMQVIRTEGIYEEYGLLSSEIYQYLGVIPNIKDMVDYCLIWNKREWDHYVWGGDDYQPGVFKVDIPLEKVPTNFNLLTNDSLQNIIDKCKSLGTKGFPVYSRNLKTLNQGSTVDIEYMQGCEITTNPPFAYSYVGDTTSHVLSTASTPLLSIYETIALNTLIQSTISTQIKEIITASKIDTDTDMNELILTDGASISGTGSSAKVQLDLATKRTGDKWATNVYDQAIGVTNEYGWTYVSKALYKNFGAASVTAGTSSGPSHYLVFNGFDFDIPEKSVITGISVLWSSYNNSGTDHSSRLDYVQLLLANTYWSSMKTSSYNTNQWTQYGLGGEGDVWGLSTTNPIYYNGSNFKVYYHTNVFSGHNAQFDYLYVDIHYKYNGGTFVTTRVVAPTVTSPKTGEWEKFTQSISLPSECSATYDIFAELTDQSMTNDNSDISFGTNTSQSLIQTVVTTQTPLTGVELKAGSTAKIGSPTDNLVLKVYSNISNTPGTLIAQKIIPNNSWTDEAIIHVPFFNSISAGSYVLSIERSGALDDSNYYQIRRNNGGLEYQNGILRYKNSSGTYVTVNSELDSLYFKTFYPSYQLTNQTAPIDLSSLPYSDIKVKGNLATTDITKTPSIDNFTITRGEVNG